MRKLAALMTLGASLLIAAPASAATITDGTGDATTGDPGHDITSFEWNYDAATGTANGTVTVAGEGADAGLLMGFGVPGADGKCSVADGMVLIGTTRSQPNAAAWQRVSGGNASGSAKPAQRSGTTTTFAIAVTSSELAGLPFTCAAAETTDPTSSLTTYDEAVATAAPTPTPTPTPAPPAPPAPAPKAELRAALTKVPARVTRGKRFRARLTVRNAGTAASARTTLRLSGAKGLKVKPGKVTVKALAPGASVTARVSVTVGRSARRGTPLAIGVRGGGVSAKKTVKVPAKRKAKPKPKPSPTPTKGGLTDTFWWWNEPDSYQGWNLYALRFYGNGYAYYRLPDDEDQTAPAKCTSVTAVPDEDGDYEDSGCVRWQLRGGKLTITDPKLSGTFSGGKLTVRRDGEKDPFETDRVTLAKPGSRLNVTLEHRDFFGFCGGITTCTTTYDQVTLQRDGQFGKVDSSLTTSGDAGGGGGLPFVAVGSYPADKRGTYEILPGYRIRLSYANGVTKVFPFGLTPKTEKGKTEPGFILGQYNYYVDPTPEDD